MDNTEFDLALAAIAFAAAEGPPESINNRRLGDVSLEAIVAHLNDGTLVSVFTVEEDHGNVAVDTDSAWI